MTALLAQEHIIAVEGTQAGTHSTWEDCVKIERVTWQSWLQEDCGCVKITWEDHVKIVRRRVTFRCSGSGGQQRGESG